MYKLHCCENCIAFWHLYQCLHVCVCLEERRARLTVCGMTRLAAVSGGEFAPHSLKFLYPLSVSVHHHRPVWLLGRRKGKRERYTSTLYICTLLFACLASHTGACTWTHPFIILWFCLLLPSVILLFPTALLLPSARKRGGRELHHLGFVLTGVYLCDDKGLGSSIGTRWDEVLYSRVQSL